MVLRLRFQEHQGDAAWSLANSSAAENLTPMNIFCVLDFVATKSVWRNGRVHCGACLSLGLDYSWLRSRQAGHRVCLFGPPVVAMDFSLTLRICFPYRLRGLGKHKQHG
eukprot:TRINITY_DN5123_c0_g1_i1.p1 TRINITY_DN5123_c0_g1~~TRINITY_DN5123_c0_g1_i1.p1  ORF type:complete len:109 (+),score=4.58 TRINITY_DN5123_c0_g1_i1:202-528(+)